MDSAIENYVKVFNEAVRSGDWASFAQSHTEDGVVELNSIPAPPMRGRTEIEAGYRGAPPNGEITVVDIQSAADVHNVTFRWTEGTGGGLVRLTMRDGLVAHNVITVDEDAA